MSTSPTNPRAVPQTVPKTASQPRFGRIDLGLEYVTAGIEKARDWLLGLQHPDGYWCGELEADSMLESDYIFMHTLLGTGDRGRMERAVNEILRHQNEDGGWSIYPGGPSNISLGVKAYLALKLMATGGLYVGGGIAPKILEKMKDGTFIKAFTDKGRMKALLEATPVSVIINDKCALLGAARYAVLRAEETRP